MGFEFKLVEHENLGELAYNSISEALMQGRLRAGERLRIRDIASKMGTSVTPVRDAILRLVQDEALILQNPRDIRVPSLSIAQYEEIRGIRVELEGMAAEKAAVLAKPKDIKRLEALMRENEAAIKARDFARGIEINQLFHFELANIAKAHILQGILNRLWVRMGPLIADAYESGGRRMVDHHPPIVDAIRKGDSAGARAAVREDIVGAGEIIVASIRKQSQAESNAPPIVDPGL